MGKQTKNPYEQLMLTWAFRCEILFYWNALDNSSLQVKDQEEESVGLVAVFELY